MAITTLADIIRVHGRARGSQTAVIQGDRRVAWSDLLDRAGQVANALAAEGVGPQDRIAFLDKNSVEHFEVFYGAALSSTPSASMSAGGSPLPRSATIVNDAEAKVFVVGAGVRPGARGDRRPSSPRPRPSWSSVGHPSFGSYEDWVSGQPADDPGVASAAERRRLPALLVGHHRSAEGRDADQHEPLRPAPGAEDLWELSEDGVNLVAMPLFHIGGGGWATAATVRGRHVGHRARASTPRHWCA